MYNFAVGGVVSIFWEGFPAPLVTQGYLVCLSATMGTLITIIFPEWTGWALLIALALYDLCAVLTPCGPLNLLIKLTMDREGEGPSQMPPGLLYVCSCSHDVYVFKLHVFLLLLVLLPYP